MPGLADVLRDALPSSASPAAKRPAEALRETYRSGAPPTSLAIADSESAAAHAAYRMPATHAAVGAALAAATTKVPCGTLARARRTISGEQSTPLTE